MLKRVVVRQLCAAHAELRPQLLQILPDAATGQKHRRIEVYGDQLSIVSSGNKADKKQNSQDSFIADCGLASHPAPVVMGRPSGHSKDETSVALSKQEHALDVSDFDSVGVIRSTESKDVASDAMV